MWLNDWKNRFGHRAYLLALTMAWIVIASLFFGWNWAASMAVLLVTAALFILVPEKRSQSGTDLRPASRQPSIADLGATQLANAISDPLVIFTRKGEVVHQNDAARRAFGNMSVGSDLRLSLRAPEILRLIDAVLENDQTQSGELSERIPVERSFRVIADPVGRGSGLFILLFKDQSETKRVDRMRTDFIANASHELRTPLASVSGFIETLKGPARNDPDARDKFLDIMQEQTARMSRLIDDLLSLSRVEMKPMLSPDSVVDLRQLVEAVIEALEHLAQEMGVTLHRQLPDQPCIVAGDYDELYQVFQNLIENACKYGYRGGRVDITLTAATRHGSPVYIASVTDRGAGIAPEHLPRITERFYRVDTDNARVTKGTGLGLAIVKHILTRHGAELTISSELGKGSTFSAIFRVARE